MGPWAQRFRGGRRRPRLWRRLVEVDRDQDFAGRWGGRGIVRVPPDHDQVGGPRHSLETMRGKVVERVRPHASPASSAGLHTVPSETPTTTWSELPVRYALTAVSRPESPSSRTSSDAELTHVIRSAARRQTVRDQNEDPRHFALAEHTLKHADAVLLPRYQSLGASREALCPASASSPFAKKSSSEPAL
jgi:hypothetical protein